MAEITVSPEFNLEYIAESAGQLDVNKRLYRNGKLIVTGVTQKALNAALAAYDDLKDGLKGDNPTEMEILKDALKTKGHITDGDLTAAKDKLRGA